ncbi:MAG: magnesium transporter [Mycolicibacterium sp.]|nr:magnesium transporter [Mycobacterium sp.]MCB9416252.1 magnesium transporter [Mycolicibacterium sp.]
MLFLSGVTGQDVLGPDGRVIGRLADLTADLVEDSGPHLVDRVVVKRGRGALLLVPWAAVANVGRDQLVLGVGAAGADRYAVDDVAEALADQEILLARDVLDTQIVDVVGQRLARVADVVLTPTADGHLELIGVEVGFGGVLRRLHLPAVLPSGEDLVAWSDLHLTSERGHAVQLGTPRSAVHHLDARGLAELVSRVDTESATEILATRNPEVAAEVVRAAHPTVGERVLRAMPAALATRIVTAMPAEHAGRWRATLQHMPALRGRRLLRSHVWPRRRHRSASASSGSTS